MKKLVACAAALALASLAPRPVQAAEGATTRPNLLCALTTIMACESVGDCERLRADEVNLSSFIRVDFKEMKIRIRKTGDERTTAIQSSTVVDGNTILSGGENGRGWSAVLSSDGERLNAAVVGDGGGFLLFANCLPE